MAAITAPALPMTRGRRAALAIGVPVCLLLIAYNGLDLVANFGEGHYPVSHTFPAGAKSLTLNVTGQLTIKPTTASRATLTGTARYSLIRPALAEHTSGGTITLGYGCKVPIGDCGLDATVTVPATVTTLTAKSGGGDATVTGTTGPVNLSSGDGDLSVSHASGPLTLNTASGNIQVSAITSDMLSASTGDGNIQATGVTSPTITENTDSGNISGSGIATATFTASTGDGAITIAFTSVPRDVQVNTDSGNITLVLPPGNTRYHVRANTDSGTKTILPDDPSSQNLITASTGNGNIIISQQ